MSPLLHARESGLYSPRTHDLMARPTFTLTVRAGPGPTWPVEAQFIADGGLPVLSHGALTLDAEELLAASTPRTYGQILGEALFCGDIRDAFVRALSVAPPAPLHVLVALDCPELRMFRWELLCAPIDDRLEFLGMTQRVAFARYISSGVDRRFRPLARDGLRALVVIANPDGLDRYSLDPFDEGAATEAVEQALGDIPHDTLSADPRALGLPTMDAICSALTRGHYSVLHVVAHGRHRRDGAEPVLFLSDDAGFARPISQTQLCERLRVVDVSLPHFIFLAACESAAERSEASMGSLAQSLVGKLGIPAVVAMSRQVSVTTASALSIAFYRRLQIHGHVDEALVEATSELSDRQDILVPALYSRLGSRPLFSRGADDADAPRRIPPDAAAASLRTPEIRRSAAIAAGLAAVAAALWFGLPGGAPDATTAPVDAVVVTPSAPSIVVERSAPCRRSDRR